MNLSETLILFLVMLPLAAMPSASVALVLARSVGAGRANGACAALGIVAGDLVFVAVALYGVSLLAGWLGAFFAVAKYGAGAYLIWFGWRLLKPDSSKKALMTQPTPSSLLSDFMAGLLLTLGDVKAILFYASLFPALVEMESIGWQEMSIIATVTLIAVGGVKLAYVLCASTIVDRMRGHISSDTPRRLGGVVMIGCGSVLIAKA